MNANFSKYLKIFLSVFLLITILLSFSAKEDFISSFSSKGLVAKVGSSKISEEEFDLAFQNAKSEISEKGAEDFEKFPEKDKLRFKKMVFDNVIRERLMVNFAQDLGLRVSDDVVVRQIKQTPLFIDEKTGVFSKEKFKTILSQYGRNEKDYVESMKDGLSMYGLFMALNSKVKIDLPAENELIAKNLYRRRIVDLISVDEEKIDAQQPHDDEIKKFYNLHTDDFKTSGFRSIQYFILNKDNFLKDVKVDESEVQKEVESILSALPRRETRSFLNVVCNSKDEVQKIHEHFTKFNKVEYQSITANKELVENMVWKELKLPACNVVDLNDRKIVEIPEEFRPMVFDDVNENKMVGDGKITSVGGQIILLKNIKQLNPKDFEAQVREKIVNNSAYNTMYFEYKAILQSQSKNTNFAELAKKYGSSLKTLDYFNDDGYFKDDTGKYILSDLQGFSRDLIHESFSLKEKSIKALESENAEVILFRLNDEKLPIPEKIMEIEKVQDRIISKLISDKRKIEAGILIEKIFADYKNGINLEKLQEKYTNISVQKGMAVENPELMSVDDTNSKFDIASAKLIFDFKKENGEAVKIDNLSKIAILREWSEADVKGFGSVSFLEMISDALHRTETIELNEILISKLKKRYKVKIYDKTLI